MNPMVNGTGLALMTMVAGVMLFIASCGDGNGEQAPELSRADVEAMVRAELAKAPAATPGAAGGPALEDVEAIVRAELAKVPAPTPPLTEAGVEEAVRRTMAEALQPEPGLSGSEVEAMIEAALAAIPEPEPGLTAAEAERIARGAVASIPPKSAPADYTRFFVQNAIARYQTQGLDATLAHYNRADSIDGQWYVFIIDGKDIVAGHPDPERRGLDLKGWVGTDANGYNFGPEMLSATEEGKWVSYVYQNPESGDIGSDDTGAFQLKNAWVVRHDGMLFGSGWYLAVDQFTQDIVAAGVQAFSTGGVDGAVAYFTSPDNWFTGLKETVEYYNSTDNVEGSWLLFIADENGDIIHHFRPEMMGRNLEDVLGTDQFEKATEEGIWVVTGDVRVWVMDHEGTTHGAGWSRRQTP